MTRALNAVKHNMSKTKPYSAWEHIKQRCFNKNDARYKNYGNRGITVCDRWKNSFENFWEDMGSEYKEGLTLDRINNDGNYCKENCRWTTQKQQSNNRTNNRFISYKNQKKTLSEWTSFLNINYTTLHMRLKRGWSLERALKKLPQRKD